ncbi:maleylpyruvate isomerase family mycothiol-dependent enzyme [Nocardia sp. NPDC024068]|uniref:maleylpyruvate isomerase family mycothiol-dependent enzyme n=1 Tax=Nocardia sp. NPDC024068 TaxID=3157197 RepID=UPI0033CE61D2
MSSDHTEELVWAAVAAERRSLAGLLAELPEAQWDHPSLCAGWRVRDIVAHILLTSRARLGWLLWQLVLARGSIARMNFETAIRYADGRTPETLLAELNALVTLRHTPVGTTATDRLMDLIVHGQDIAVPLGLEREIPTQAARWSADRIWEMGWPFHAQRDLAGHRLIATDAQWSAGTGTPVRAPIAELLLMLTGRKPVPTISPA